MLEWEGTIRIGFFVGIFLLMALLEGVIPKRALVINKQLRWVNNLSLVVLNSIILRLLFPITAMGLAVWAEQNQWGLLHNIVAYDSLILTVKCMIAACFVIFLDFAIWYQHWLFHRVSLLWRLHRVHHADQDIDVTTGLRFHPIEIVLSMCIKMGLVLLFGVPAIAILIFEVILNVLAMFNHSNVEISKSIDRYVRMLIVTPDMHRVHHSWHIDETNSNYGFCLSCWDRVFKTYRDQPRAGHKDMVIGLSSFRRPEAQRLDQLIIQPLMKD